MCDGHETGTLEALCSAGYKQESCVKNQNEVGKDLQNVAKRTLDLCAKLLQLYPTLCDAMDCSPPGSSVYGILQAKVLAAMPSSRGSS